MKCNTFVVRSGFDKTKCFVHARCCDMGNMMIATSQHLNISGSDLFDGICLSKSFDKGKTWTEFMPQEGLKPLNKDGLIIVGSDATPMYHKKSGKVILLGHTVTYKPDSLYPLKGANRCTFYSVFDEKTQNFSKMKLINMPNGYERCGNGCGQSIELDDGNLLIPVYYTPADSICSRAAVMLCSFDGENINIIKIGSSLEFNVARGLDEPSIIFHDGTYYMTLRNDECALLAKSEDGLNYTDMQLLKWEDGSIVQSYNTQQHFTKIGDKLYLVYTRRGANNDHVFRHRAPLFAAEIKDMRLVKETEFAVVPERGARLGNFYAGNMLDNTPIVMAAEWMQPKGCEKYGSDNSVFFVKLG